MKNTQSVKVVSVNISNISIVFNKNPLVMLEKIQQLDTMSIAEYLSLKGENDVPLKMDEYFKYMALKLSTETRLAISSEIDPVWHAHILHTELYHEFCDSVNNGNYIHHTPDHLINDVDLTLGFQNTILAYEQVFDTKPDKKFWGSKICW